MTISIDELHEALDVARDYLGSGRSDVAPTRLLAETLVKLSEHCLVGVPCEKHQGMTHGQEAEELRSGIEQIIENTISVESWQALSVLHNVRKSLIFLLDQIDARDSAMFCEAKAAAAAR